jgi:hypothetical protein
VARWCSVVSWVSLANSFLLSGLRHAAGKCISIVDLAGLKMSDAAGEAFRFIR